MSSLDPETLTLGGLFVAGLVTSLHCAGMCGLLTCGLGIVGKGPAIAVTGIYHICRLIGYALAGTLAGFVGGSFGLDLSLVGVAWLPLLLIVFLLAISLGFDKKFGAIPGLGKVSLAIRMKTISLPVPLRAAIVGLATPLLPCGPLYAIIALAIASGSALRGAETMLVFGLGAIPAIWAVQVGSSWMSRKLGQRGFGIARRSLAVLAALSLLWHFPFPGQVDAEGRPIEPTCRCSSE